MKTHVTFQVLSEQERQRIEDYAVRLLEEIGVWVQCDRALELFTSAGYQEENRRVKIPEARLREFLGWYEKRLHAWWDEKHPEVFQKPETGIQPAPEKLGLGDNVPWIYDWRTGELRQGRLQDQIEACQVANAVDRIGGVSDVVDLVEFHPQTRPFHAFVTCAELTKKAVLATHEITPENWKYFHELAVVMAGGEEEFRKKPTYGSGACMSSPMRMAKFLTDKLFIAYEHRLGGSSTSSMPMAGANAPMSLAAAIGLGFAEVFSAGILHRLLGERYGPLPFTLAVQPVTVDMRFMQDLYASPDSVLAWVGVAEMCEHLGWRVGGAKGAHTEAKEPDVQCGFERGISGLLSMLSGGDWQVALGQLDTMQVFCLEQVFIDLEMLNLLERIPEGIEVREKDFDLDLARSGINKFTFADEPNTAANFRRELYIPTLFTREPVEQFVASKMSIRDRAREQVRQVLDNPPPPDPKYDEDTLQELGKIVERADQEFAG